MWTSDREYSQGGEERKGGIGSDLRVIKDREGNVPTSEESGLRRWKE